MPAAATLATLTLCTTLLRPVPGGYLSCFVGVTNPERIQTTRAQIMAPPRTDVTQWSSQWSVSPGYYLEGYYSEERSHTQDTRGRYCKVTISPGSAEVLALTFEARDANDRVVRETTTTRRCP